jgi:soluble lytic murein transglycosylase
MQEMADATLLSTESSPCNKYDRDMHRLLTAALLLIACAAAAADSADALPQAEFLAALQRARMSVPEPPDSPALKSYPIYDYLVAARLQRDLAASPSEEGDTAIDDFLRAHEGQPVGRALRHQWLVSLAQRRRWDWFLPRSVDAADPVLICDRLTGRLLHGDTDRLGPDALARWSVAQHAPAECAPVFAWLHAQGLITPALQEARARAALAADNAPLAREFIAEVPAVRAAALRAWLALLESPKAALAALAEAPGTAVESEALVAGFTRLSNTDVVSAADLLPALLGRPDLSAAVRGRLQRALALGEAYARKAGAVAAFERLPADAVDMQVQEWRVRAALWAGNYARALEWLDRMPASLSGQPRWRYWRARALAATSGPEAAAASFADLAGMRDYYGYLAADRVSRPYSLNVHPTAEDAALQSALAAEPGLVRAHALFDCDLTDEASAEWSAALAQAPAAMKIQAAHLASRWGWYSQTIATLAQADDWDDVLLRYPRPFSPVIADAGKLTQVPADWIFAVTRQESLFRKDAVSRADARGLMQMQPATAFAVAKRWHLPPPRGESLFDPAVAVTLGAAYLRELLDRYGNQLDLALAAYNAGPASVTRWLPAQPVEADVWIENIPYTETRGYVEHVLEHIVAFAVVRDAEPPKLAALLPPVHPAAAPVALSPPDR